MNSFDLIIRNGNVVTDAGIIAADIGVSGETITAIASGLSATAPETIEANGLHIFPGVIDAHVHFNDPGRADWEGIETGSSAIAAGGGTMYFDMPLNAHPPTLDAESFRLKRSVGEAKSVVDFALWGGLTPANLDQMPELAECGVIGFKAFMCPSGIDDFLYADEKTLRAGMKRAATLGRIVGVHAEVESKLVASKGTGIRDYLNSRPIEAELEAIRIAVEIAGETGCKLHVVHVSSAAGVRLVTGARQRGVDVTCETCPHYLALTDEDVERLGPVAKCAPPLRPAAETKQLFQVLAAGEIATIGSDHSPAPSGMKTDLNFFKVWGGISGAQHLLPLLITLGLDLRLLSQVVARNVAERFELPKSKGRIAVGCDADLAIVDLGAQFEVKREELLYRHRQSPYIGWRLRGVTRRTLVRGRTVFQDGRITGQPSSRLITPAPVC